ncbi:MAG: tetratricopeptide repeat protein [Bacteroidetes bacterium]|nr:tetratricopeptide repeat protein [Bacteroidota bacterium]
MQKDPILKLSRITNFYLFYFGIALLLFLQSCSVKKNNLGNRVYHNITAHYNAYWNGKESYKEGLKQLNSSLRNNYSEILPIFNYGTDQDAKALIPFMERAIQKSSVVIQQHSMRFKNKEYNRWVDDAYLLLGKSYFYLGEYVSARRTFEFIIDGFKSTPAEYEAMLWLVRTYNRTRQFEKSGPLLKQFQDLIDYEKVPLSQQREFPMIYANFYLLQEKYTESVDLLNDAIEINNDKQLITRLKFILAQVYQNQGNLEAASELYLEVVHRNPTYEMAFNARINMAKSYYAGAGNSDEIIQSLEVLLKDSKNEEFRDQIYHVLAEIALKEGDQSSAINYLIQAVALSSNNNFQKVASSIALADSYFNKGIYKNAKLYYDTALQVMPIGYPDQQALIERTRVLVSLVAHLETIQLQDSLQKISRMPEEERLTVIDAIISEIASKEKVEQTEQLERMQDLSIARQQQNTFSQNQGSGAWYFYNPSTLSYGFTEFISKWGRRPLEDNWRLSQKQVQNMGFSENASRLEIRDEEDLKLQEKAISKKDRNYYLKDIPLNEIQLQESNNKIIEALYQSAMLFKEGLKDTARAIVQFEALIQNYPDNEYKIQAHYYLHKLYLSRELNKSTYYKQQLLSQFPNSDYAKVIINPDYFKQSSALRSEIETLYFDAYQAHENEQYYVSINLCDRAIASYNDSILIPKFEYIRALSMGRIEEVDSLLINLKRIIAKYPDSEVVPLAKNLIFYLNSTSTQTGRDSIAMMPVEEEIIGNFYFHPDTTHLYILIINTERVNLEAVKLRLSDFNLKLAFLKPLTIANFIVSENNNWLAVMGLGNKQEAQDYINEMNKDAYVLSIFNKEEYRHFVISANNYWILLQDKNIDEYLKFYYKHYQTTN